MSYNIDKPVLHIPGNALIQEDYLNCCVEKEKLFNNLKKNNIAK